MRVSYATREALAAARSRRSPVALSSRSIPAVDSLLAGVGRFHD